jgi:hypothetical protein
MDNVRQEKLGKAIGINSSCTGGKVLYLGKVINNNPNRIEAIHIQQAGNTFHCDIMLGAFWNWLRV